MSFPKNLRPLTHLPPRPVITWDKYERIKRNQEIWSDKSSVVHRLPKHYQLRYWKNILLDRTPVHYKPPPFRFYWDENRKVEIETENFPILPEYVPEQDQGLWGGEGVVKSYKRSRAFVKKKVLPRHWVPHLYFPNLKRLVFYSEILDKHMWIVSTSRTVRLVEDAHGFDYYILETPEIDLNSKLGCTFKRLLLTKLAKDDYYLDNEERHIYIKQKYAKYKIPLEETEWVGLDLNEACRKLQDIEDNTKKTPLKFVFEQELVNSLIEEDALKEDMEIAKNETNDDETHPATSKKPVKFNNQELGVETLDKAISTS
ncbi:ribophorin II [Ditylenchus destructor]|uniref:Ribophorin II n=1 Tax=Ditylenchus destructor TaxID=166010 RepID=A0AAD4R137_9BILA|nr:ribophorin II [Ditylenchus destructor]